MAGLNHVVYDNFILESEIEDQFNTMIDLQQYFVVDTSLTETAGMVKKINRYSATDSTEELGLGEGNTTSIEVTFNTYEYRVKLAQNQFDYYDEQAMTDPMLIPTGIRRMSSGLFNYIDADFMRELKKATMKIEATAWSVDLFADAVGMIDVKGTDNAPESIRAFCFMNPKDIAKIRKLAKDTLQYNESFVRQGYVGTLYGVDIISKKNQAEGETEIALKQAVTAFIKTGVEVEQDRNANPEDKGNTRHNFMWSRKYYLVALTDATKVVKVVIGGDRVGVAPLAQSDSQYEVPVSDIQGADLAVADGRITGTSKYLAGSNAITDVWGEGNFIALGFDVPAGADPTKVYVGLEPSSGSGLVHLETDDKKGVFKISNKANQKFVVKFTQNGINITQKYDLDKIVCKTEAESVG